MELFDIIDKYMNKYTNRSDLNILPLVNKVPIFSRL